MIRIEYSGIRVASMGRTRNRRSSRYATLLVNVHPSFLEREIDEERLRIGDSGEISTLFRESIAHPHGLQRTFKPDSGSNFEPWQGEDDLLQPALVPQLVNLRGREVVS